MVAIPRDAGHERRQPLDLVATVVEAGDEQRDDLDPELHRMEPADRVENRLEPATELTVVAIVEALEIDLIEIDPRPDVLEHLWRAVSVRDVTRDQAGGLGLFEDGDRPLAGNQWLVVSADHDARLLSEGIGGEVAR